MLTESAMNPVSALSAMPHVNPEKIIIGADLQNKKLDGRDLSKHLFVGCDFRGATLREANLKLTGFFQCRAEEANFTDADLSVAFLPGLYAPRSCWNRAKLHGSIITGSMLNGALFRGTEFLRAEANELKAEDADFTGARFTNGSLNGANLMSTRLDGASFEKMEMTLCSLHNAYVNKRSVNFKYCHLDRSGWARARFLRLDGAVSLVFQGCLMSNSDFSDAFISGIKFSGGFHCKLDCCWFDRADLSGADLIEVNLRGSSFRDANLRGALLCRSDLTESDTTGADFTDANLSNTVILNARGFEFLQDLVAKSIPPVLD